MSPKKDTRKSAKRSAATPKKTEGFTAEERAAAKERVKEMRAGPGEADGESVVLAKIDEMAESDRAMGRRVHALIMAAAPGLSPRLWYGMPAYAKDDKVICHFQDARKFK